MMTYRRRSSAMTREPHHSPSFWRCDFSHSEILLLAVGIIGAVILHLDPVLNSGFAKPFLLGLGVLCFFSPVSGFFFLSACAILPTASAEIYALAREVDQAGGNTVGMTDSGTKFAFFSWLIAVPLCYHRFRLRGIHLLWPILPWLLWMFLTNGIRGTLRPDLIKSLLFCVMACQLANEARGQYIKCLMGLGLGFLVITLGFWANTVGLPVQLADWGGERTGFTRMGSVVADSVMLWPPLLCGIGTFLGVAAGYGSKAYKGRPPTWIPRIAIFVFLFSLPPLLAAMTNSGLVGLVLLLGIYGLSLAQADGSGNVRKSRGSGLWMMVGGLLIGATTMVATNAFDSRARITALFEFYEEQSEELGATASRNEVWEASWDTISRYPLLGVVLNRGKENIPAGYADRGYYFSHNVFLDYARSAGIPGALLFAYFILWPVIQIVKSRKIFPYNGFLLAYFGFFLFLMSLSFQWYKSLWAFWMLAAMATSMQGSISGATNRIGIKRRRKSNKLRERSIPPAEIESEDVAAELVRNSMPSAL